MGCQPIKEKREAWEGVGLGQIRPEQEVKQVKKEIKIYKNKFWARF